jgi:hypothetical protein
MFAKFKQNHSKNPVSGNRSTSLTQNANVSESTMVASAENKQQMKEKDRQAPSNYWSKFTAFAMNSGMPSIGGGAFCMEPSKPQCGGQAGPKPVLTTPRTSFGEAKLNTIQVCFHPVPEVSSLLRSHLLWPLPASSWWRPTRVAELSSA